MFDVSLGELLVISAVTLVVVGPEKMPKVARTAGMLFGRLQRFVNNVKSDLQREMQASELAQVVSVFKLVEGEQVHVAQHSVLETAPVASARKPAPHPAAKAKPALKRPAPAAASAKPKKIASAASAASDEWEEF